MAERQGIEATDGTIVIPTDCEHDYTYDVDGNVLTDTMTNKNGHQFRITYTWVGGLPTHETRLVRL